MRAIHVTPVLAGLILVASASQLCAQSLADVARKEEERRKTQPQPTKVYTNKDLEPVAPPSTPPPATPGASGTDSAQATPAAGSKDAQKDEKTETKGQAYWSSRRKTLQDTLDRDSTYVEALQSRINALTTDFVNRDDPAQRATIGQDRQKAVSELERLKAQVIQDRKALTDLEEEARRAGVPPGWLR
ncbi:MAG TPA: hypothetical protein VH583_13770 [Vicinamibacterales bacterium]